MSRHRKVMVCVHHVWKDPCHQFRHKRSVSPFCSQGRYVTDSDLISRLFIAFAGYFALGAYYNYTTYGATGVDLILCVCSLLHVVGILKHLSWAEDMEIFGARCHTCYEMSSRIFVVLSNPDKAQVGEGIFRYNPWFRITFLSIMFSGLCERA